MKELHISDLSADACYCDHESYWQSPFNGDAARRIDDIIRKCTRARGWKNIGCAHYYMQEVNGVEFMFQGIPNSFEGKKRIRQEYEQLHQTKLYIDQLTRRWYGINLSNLGDNDYAEDPRYVASIYALNKEDPLRIILERLKVMLETSKFGLDYTQLLHKADDMICARMNCILETIKKIAQK